MKRIIVTVLSMSIFTFAANFSEPFDYDPFMEIANVLNVDENGNVIKPKPAIASAVFLDKAYINGKWYKTGDTFGDYNITSITTNSIELSNKSKTKILQVGGESDKILKIKDKK